MKSEIAIDAINNINSIQGIVIIFSIGIAGIFGSIIRWQEKNKKWKSILIYYIISLIVFIITFRDIVLISIIWLMNIIIVLFESRSGRKKETNQ